MTRYFLSALLVAALALPLAADTLTKEAAATANKDSRFYEMRTYHAAPGKFEALRARFHDFNNQLMVKHGMDIVGSWMPMDKNGKSDSIVYVLAYPTHEARDKAWREFSSDLEWLAVKTDSEQHGKLVVKVDSVFMLANDLPMMKLNVMPPQ